MTPSGTRTWRISSPLASVAPRTTSPTGSGRVASERSPSAMAVTRAELNRSRSTMASEMPAAVCSLTSASLASRMPAQWRSRASAIARSAASLTALEAAAKGRADSRARSAAASTSVLLIAQGYGVGTPRRRASQGLAGARRSEAAGMGVGLGQRRHVVACLKGLPLDHLEADNLPGRQAGGASVLVPQPQCQGGSIDHLLALLPVLQLDAVPVSYTHLRAHE